MTMHLPSTMGSFMTSRGLLSDIQGVRRRQISRVNAYAKGERFNAKENRRLRKAELKQKLWFNSMPREKRVLLEENPRQHGLPRRFKVLVAGHEVTADCKVHDSERYEDEGHMIHFAAFGIPGRPIQFNGTWIRPNGAELSPDGRIYTISVPEHDGTFVRMYLDFTILDTPTGYLEHPNGHFALQLEPYAVSFNVDVSKNAGAYQSTGSQTFTWDETSPKWINATWDKNTMVFSYDTIKIPGPFGDTYLTEVSFQDNDDPNNIFTLDQSVQNQHTAAVNGTVGSGQDAYLQVTVTGATIPTISETRTKDADGITSVYPISSLFKFDELGMNFTGAYIVSNDANPQIFAVVGTGQSPFLAPGVQIPIQETAHLNGTSKPTVKPVFQSKVTPTKHFGATAGAGPIPMPITGLLNNDPMKPDPNSSTGYTDTISVKSNADFYNIILYWMDPDIHKTFISPNPTVLENDILAIATDDPTNNKLFYQSLTTPYITQSLGSTPGFDLGKQCNAMRASAQLKDIPTNSDVYKRHSDTLYKLRYLQQFSNIQTYLNDQAKTDYSASIANGAFTMKTNITNVSKGVNGSDPSVLQNALADIDSLAAWATSQKLFYAFSLYYWASTYLLASMSAQSGNGTLSPTISRTLKKITTILGVLENSQQNPNGKSFAEAFNDMIRVYQMTSLIPQFVDCDGNVSDFDSIMKEMLTQFYNDNSHSSDPNIAKEANLAIQLANSQAAIQGFMQNLAISMRLTGSLGSWSATVNNFTRLNVGSGWYSKLANASDMATTFMRASCVALLVLPMLSATNGGWKNMSKDQKISWTATASGLFLTFTIKVIQGALRVIYYWTDLGGFGVNVFKAFFGSAKVLSSVADASEATTSTFAQWLIRTGSENMDLAGEEISLAMKCFGRSAGEFLANCVGAVLAGVNIVMSIIDAVKTKDPMEKAMDSMMIISSGFQLLAIGASWLVSAEIVTTEVLVDALEVAGACLGPLAIVFAIAGLVLMIVMMFRKGPPPSNPVQDFIDNQVNSAGLKMPNHTAIDYFNVVPADPSAGSLNGISFKVSGNNSSQYLQLGPSNNASPPVYPAMFTGAISYLPDTCWCVKTDSSGNSMVFTYILDQDNNKTSVCLGEQSDGSVAILPVPQKTTKDNDGNIVVTPADVFAKQMAVLQWTFTAQSNPTQVTRTFPVPGSDNTKITYTTQADFSLTRDKKNLYVVQANNGSYTLQLSASAPANSFSNFTLAMETMGPSSFSYVQSSWTLNLTDTDMKDFVNFSGTTSLPLQWSVTPALPSFLVMGDPNTDPGSIKQVSGVNPTLMAAQPYTVTAKISILGTTYSKSATVTINVIDGTKPPSSPTLKAVNIQDGDNCPTAFRNGGLESSRSRGTVASGKTDDHSMKSATNDGDQVDPLFKVQISLVGQVDPEVQSRFNNMMSTAPAFFKWLPFGIVNVNDHYTAAGAIQTMQNSVSGQWQPQLGCTQNYADIYFPHRSGKPYNVPNDPINYGSAVNSFVAQAIYNGDGYAQVRAPANQG